MPLGDVPSRGIDLRFFVNGHRELLRNGEFGRGFHRRFVGWGDDRFHGRPHLAIRAREDVMRNPGFALCRHAATLPFRLRV